MKRLSIKILSIILILILFFPQTSVWAIDVPSPPTAPSAPPDAPSAPEAPSAPSAPTPIESEPTSPEPNNTSTPTEPTPTESSSTSGSVSETETTPTSFNQVSDGNSGDTTIVTGDATNSGTATTSINTNILENVAASTNPDGTQVINSDNGTSSENTGSVDSTTNTTTVQDNNANVENSLELSTATGDNSASKNVCDSYIQTGDANTTGTLLTYANTNINGVAVSEFNVVDDQNGDLILDFAQNCIVGCDNYGAESTNSAAIDQTNNNTTIQNNNADVGNNLILSSDSGSNTSSYNTGGDSVIKTGDANTSGSVLSFLNNNIAGQVILGVVNIFGDLVGDIIFPESQTACNNCSTTTTVANTGNGAESDNTATVNQASTDTTFQSNIADIDNNLILASTTGDNSTSKNTGGDSVIKTGSADVTSQTVNVVNTNVEGGNIWLVLVNQMGQWVGTILGAPSGSNFAGSSGTQITTGPNGEIGVTNSGNGTSSDNLAAVDQTTNNTTIQNNNAKLVNNIDLSANTGGNQASYNTGGTSYINSGDAKAIANLINFVNNNVSSGQRLVVTVVNVFGSWLGDFVTPGTKKENSQTNTIAQGSTNQEVTPALIESEPNSSTSTQKVQSNNQIVNPTPSPIASVQNQNNQSQNNQIIAAGSIETPKTPENGQVAGANSDLKNVAQQQLNNAKKILSLNLAWLLLVPLIAGVLILIYKALILTRRLLPKRSVDKLWKT